MPPYTMATWLMQATCHEARASPTHILHVGLESSFLLVWLQCGAKEHHPQASIWLVWGCISYAVGTHHGRKLPKSPVSLTPNTLHQSTTSNASMQAPKLGQQPCVVCLASKFHCLNHFATYCPLCSTLQKIHFHAQHTHETM
jgi:hypothetical protein